MTQKNIKNRRVRDQARKQVQDLNGFDYGAPAKLFVANIKSTKGKISHKRFETAAEALRFAVEQIPAPALSGMYLEVNEARFGSQEIQYLYANVGYPLRPFATDE
jgi:hypothetical protein